MRVTHARGVAAVAKPHLAVALRDLRAQRLVLQTVRLVLAKIGEVLERRVIHERNQPVVPGHAPAIVEQRRRQAGDAGHVLRKFRSQHQRKNGAERKTADHQRHAFDARRAARVEKRFPCRSVDLAPRGARQHRHRLAMVDEARTGHVAPRSAAQPVREIAQLGRASGQAMQQHDPAAAGTAQRDAAVGKLSRFLRCQPRPLDGHVVLCEKVENRSVSAYASALKPRVTLEHLTIEQMNQPISQLTTADVSEEEATLLAKESRYCSYGDTVHYAEKPKLFYRCKGSYLYHLHGGEYRDLQMCYSTGHFG